MDLHRASKQPDWAAVPIPSRNAWQRLAARTNGFLTPGNLLTFLGVLLVLAGLVFIQYHRYSWGLFTLAVGRLCDIWDGMAAARTGTKSPLGEMLDVTADKVASLLALILLLTAHVLPLIAAIAVLLPNLANSVVTFMAEARHIRLHPSRVGKNWMAFSWVGLSCFIAAHFSPLSDIGRILGYTLIAIAFGMGTRSSLGYIADFRRGLAK